MPGLLLLRLLFSDQPHEQVSVFAGRSFYIESVFYDRKRVVDQVLAETRVIVQLNDRLRSAVIILSLHKQSVYSVLDDLRDRVDI